MPAKKTKASPRKSLSNSKMNNGLGEAVFGGSPFGYGPPGANGVQLSQTNTLYKNERWYLVSNERQILNQMYAEHGIVQNFVDIPVEDGLRGGIEVKSKQLSEDQIQELLIEIDRQDDVRNFGQAEKWNRLFGGAGVVIMTGQTPETPLDIASITDESPLEFRAVDMWELFWDKQNTEGYNPELQEQDFEFYSYYGKKLHKSRVLKLKGINPPSFIRPRLRGWGLSVIDPVIRGLNQYFKATDLTFEVLDEFKLDIYKIKNLSNTLLSSNGDAIVRKRVQLANVQKNYQNAITMDAEDDYLQKELSFSGLAEVMQGIRMQIASDLRMPLTKLFGISATGFNSGEDDIENYNAMIESQVRSKLKYPLLKMVEIRCQKLFEFIPDDLQIAFKPLRMLSAEQEENVKSQKFARLMQARTTGEMSSEEFQDSCNKDNLLGVQVSSMGLDTNEEDENENDADNKDQPDDGEESGADRIDSKAPKLKQKAPKSTVQAKQPKNSFGSGYEYISIPSVLTENPIIRQFFSLPYEMQNRFSTIPGGSIDKDKWAKAKELALKENHKGKTHTLTNYIYQQMGGEFKKAGHS